MSFPLLLNKDITSAAVGFNPLGYSNLELWFDFSDVSTLSQDSGGATPVTSDGDTIGRADDKSTKGRNFTQTSSVSKPVYKVNQQNNLSVAQCTPNEFLSHSDLTALSALSEFTIYSVAMVSGNTLTGPILDKGIGALGDREWSLEFQKSGADMFPKCAVADESESNVDNAQVASPVTQSQYYQIIGRFSLSGNDLSVFQDGVETNITSDITAIEDLNSILRLGADRGGRYLTGAIGEVVMYSDYHTGNTFTTLAEDQRTKWGIS